MAKNPCISVKNANNIKRNFTKLNWGTEEILKNNFVERNHVYRPQFLYIVSTKSKNLANLTPFHLDNLGLKIKKKYLF